MKKLNLVPQTGTLSKKAEEPGLPKSTKIFRLKEKVGLTSFLYVILWRVGIVTFADESTFDLVGKVIIILLIFNQLQFMGYLGEAKESSDSKWN